MGGDPNQLPVGRSSFCWVDKEKDDGVWMVFINIGWV